MAGVAPVGSPATRARHIWKLQFTPIFVDGLGDGHEAKVPGSSERLARRGADLTSSPLRHCCGRYASGERHAGTRVVEIGLGPPEGGRRQDKDIEVKGRTRNDGEGPSIPRRRGQPELGLRGSGREQSGLTMTKTTTTQPPVALGPLVKIEDQPGHGQTGHRGNRCSPSGLDWLRWMVESGRPASGDSIAAFPRQTVHAVARGERSTLCLLPFASFPFPGGPRASPFLRRAFRGARRRPR